MALVHASQHDGQLETAPCLTCQVAQHDDMAADLKQAVVAYVPNLVLHPLIRLQSGFDGRDFLTALSTRGPPR